MESRYQPHLSQQLHMPVYCAICDLSSACLICNPESAPFSEVTAFRAGTVNVAQLPATPLSLAAASESTRTALDCEDASWVRSLPRDVDETILPFVDAESPLVWPPLPAAERERKAKGQLRLAQKNVGQTDTQQEWLSLKPTRGLFGTRESGARHRHTLPNAGRSLRNRVQLRSPAKSPLQLA